MTQREQGAGGTPSRRRIPSFKSIEEAAAFWDNHDSAAFEDEFEDLDEEIRLVVTRGEPTKAITVRLPETTAAALSKAAQEQGVAPSALVRIWVQERLNQPTPGH